MSEYRFLVAGGRPLRYVAGTEVEHGPRKAPRAALVAGSALALADQLNEFDALRNKRESQRARTL